MLSPKAPLMSAPSELRAPALGSPTWPRALLAITLLAASVSAAQVPATRQTPQTGSTQQTPQTPQTGSTQQTPPPPATAQGTQQAQAPQETPEAAPETGEETAPVAQQPPGPTAETVQIPIFLEGSAPELPAGVSLSRPAEVKLRITVDVEGHVSDVVVMRSAGTKLDEAAIRAVSSWRFRPAQFQGEPIEVQSDVPLVFVPPTDAQQGEGSVRVRTEDGPPEGVAISPREQHADDPADSDDEAEGSHVHVHDGHVHDHGDRHDHPHLLIQSPPTSSEERRETVVRAAALPPPSVAASDFRIRVGALADVPRRSASELMTLAPGVMLTNHGGQGHADSIFLRGFAAGEGKDVELKLAGVPLNDISNAHAHGYAQTYFIIPEVVSGLRVIEGPFDAAQGDFGVAGTVEYELGLARRGITLSGSYGSYESSRALVLWGPKDAGEETFVGALFRNGAGFGLNRAYTNTSVMAQTRLNLPDNSHLTLMGTFYGGRFGSAGVIRESDLVTGSLPCPQGPDSQFFCSPDPSQGGAELRMLGSARLSQRFDDGGRMQTQLSVVQRSLRLRTNYTGFTADLPPPGEAQRGDLTEQSYAGTTVSLEGVYTPQFTLFEQPRALEFGYRARLDDVDTRSRRLRDRGGAPYATLFDNGVTAGNVSVWGKLTVRPIRRLILRGGLRLESFLFSVTDRNRPTSDRLGERLGDEQLEAYGVLPAPRLSAEWLLTDHWSLLAAGGLGARSSDAAALSDAEFAPFARVTAAELGTRYARTFERVGLEARTGVFGTHVSNDLVFDELAGRNVPVGASNRLGVFASGRFSLDNRLDLQASTALTQATLPGPNGGLDGWLNGESLPYVPRLIARGDGSWRGDFQAFSEDFGWALSMGASFIGPRPLPLGRFSEPIFLLDAGARLTWKALELGLDAQNLLDARWREAEYHYVSNFRGAEAAPSLLASRHFSAGAPFHLRATLSVNF